MEESKSKVPELTRITPESELMPVSAKVPAPDLVSEVTPPTLSTRDEPKEKTASVFCWLTTSSLAEPATPAVNWPPFKAATPVPTPLPTRIPPEVIVLKPESVTTAGALTRKALMVAPAEGWEETVASTLAPVVQVSAV